VTALVAAIGSRDWLLSMVVYETDRDNNNNTAIHSQRPQQNTTPAHRTESRLGVPPLLARVAARGAAACADIRGRAIIRHWHSLYIIIGTIHINEIGEGQCRNALV
jgi:hypothetical protein